MTLDDKVEPGQPTQHDKSGFKASTLALLNFVLRLRTCNILK